jgi:hypothetical protein
VTRFESLTGSVSIIVSRLFTWLMCSIKRREFLHRLPVHPHKAQSASSTTIVSYSSELTFETPVAGEMRGSNYRGRDSSVGMVNRYGLEVRGLNPGGGEIS